MKKANKKEVTPFAITWAEFRPNAQRGPARKEALTIRYVKNVVGKKIHNNLYVYIPGSIVQEMGWTDEDRFLILGAQESYRDFAVVASPNGYRKLRNNTAGGTSLRVRFERPGMKYFDDVEPTFKLTSDHIHLTLPEA